MSDEAGGSGVSPGKTVRDAVFVGIGELPSGRYPQRSFMGDCVAVSHRLAEGVQLLARLLPDADGSFDAYQCDQAVDFVPSPAGVPATERPSAWFRRVP